MTMLYNKDYKPCLRTMLIDKHVAANNVVTIYTVNKHLIMSHLDKQTNKQLDRCIPAHTLPRSTHYTVHLNPHSLHNTI